MYYPLIITLPLIFLKKINKFYFLLYINRGTVIIFFKKKIEVH